VEAATRIGLVDGYEDGSYHPNDPITRAQVCITVNRALGRKPDANRLLNKRLMVSWPDVTPEDPFYADVMEATNSHEYRWYYVKGDPKGAEGWTAKLPQRNWAALEESWSTAHSAPGGDVATGK